MTSNRKSVLLSFTALTLGLAALLPAAASDAACQLHRLASFPVEIHNNQITVTGSLNHHPIEFLVDTGFPSTIILSPNAGRYDLAVGDLLAQQNYHTMPVGKGYTDEMRIGKLPVTHAILGVFGKRLDFGDKSLVALLGNDIWAGYDLEIDLPHKTINLMKPEGCQSGDLAYWTNSFNMVDIDTSSGKVLLQVALNGHKVTAALDSGTPYSTVSDKFAGALGIAADSAETVKIDTPHYGAQQSSDMYSLTQITYGLGYNLYRSPDIYQFGDYNPFGRDPQAPRYSYVGKFANLTLDGETIAPAKLQLKRLPMANPETGSHLPRPVFTEDLALGVDFLRSHHVLISYSQQKLYFTYEGGAAFQVSDSGAENPEMVALTIRD